MVGAKHCVSIKFGFGDYDEHNPLADVQALAKVWSVLKTKS